MKSRVVLGGVLLAGMASSGAYAADLPAHQPATAPAPVATSGASAWQGFYIGASLSESVGNTKFNVGNGAVTFDGLGSRGTGAGVLAGYNYVFGNGILLGLEGSVDHNGQAIDIGVDSYGGTLRAKAENDFSGALNARIGYLTTPSTLVYGSVGAVALHGVGSYDLVVPTDSILMSDTKKDYFYGLATVTGGIETRVSGNWRARYEYAAEFLKAKFYRGTLPIEVQPRTGVARYSLIYSFGDNAPMAPASFTPTWTGAFVALGGGREQKSNEYTLEISREGNLDLDGFGSDGWSGQATAGFNYQFASRWVAGLEAAGTVSDAKNRFSYLTASLIGDKNRTASARLRAGYLLSPETLAYVIGGVSERLNGLTLAGVGGEGLSRTYRRHGVDLGAGMETFVSAHVSVRAEFVHSRMNAVNMLNELPAAGRLKETSTSGTFSAAYHF